MSDEILESSDQSEATARVIEPNSVVLGVLVGFDGAGQPQVAYPGNPDEAGMRAQSIAPLDQSQLGRRVALLFEGGDLRRPIVMGLLQNSDDATPESTKRSSSHVDASVFPRVPGLFIVSAIYLIAEKAADAVIATAKG